MRKFKKEKNGFDSEKFVCVKTDGTIFNFDKFKNSLDLASDIYRNKSLLENVEDKQNEIKILLNKPKDYNPTNLKKIKAKEETLIAVEKLLNNRQEVIDAFKRSIFPYIDGFPIKEKSEEESEEESKKERTNKFENKILRMNQKALIMSCLKNILNLQYLLFWKKHYLKQKIKRKTLS